MTEGFSTCFIMSGYLNDAKCGSFAGCLMERHGNDNVLMMSWRINKYWDYFYLCYRID